MIYFASSICSKVNPDVIGGRVVVLEFCDDFS